MVEPKLIADYQCEIGEGPMWHPMEGQLYWVDIPQGKIFRYDPTTGRHEQCHEGDVIGGFTVQADGALLLFMARGAVAVWRDGKLEYLIDEISDEQETRFNDVFADPMGRVFCGTMPAPDRPGRLYRLDRDGSLRMILENIGISNGMGFTPDLKCLYYTDSSARKIYLFDYNKETGDLGNQRVFVETTGSGGFPDGMPDGMTVDADGYVWSARWDGSALYRYSPDGTQERRIPFSAKKVSSVTFGGEDYSDIYVTTAGGQDKAQNGSGAGALFMLRLGIKGKPEFLSRIGL